MWIEGAIAVKAALKEGKRTVLRLCIDNNKRSKDLSYIQKLAAAKKIAVEKYDRSFLDELATGKSHGGILAEVSARQSDELIDSDILYLDGIEDPFNLGYLMRTAYAFGISNIILPKRDYSSMEAQLLKSSAGAFDMLNILFAEDIPSVFDSLKDKYRFYSLKRGDDARDIFQEEFAERCLFMIGGEKRGISAGLLQYADRFLYIPYANDFHNSLSGSAAGDVVMTLLFNQKRGK